MWVPAWQDRNSFTVVYTEGVVVKRVSGELSGPQSTGNVWEKDPQPASWSLPASLLFLGRHGPCLSSLLFFGPRLDLLLCRSVSYCSLIVHVPITSQTENSLLPNPSPSGNFSDPEPVCLVLEIWRCLMLHVCDHGKEVKPQLPYSG